MVQPSPSSTSRNHALPDEARLHEASVSLGVPFVRLRHRKIEERVLRRIPLAEALKHYLVAYEEEHLASGRKVLRVAVADPATLEEEAPRAVTELHTKDGYLIEVALSPRADIEAVLRQPRPSAAPPTVSPLPAPVKQPSTTALPAGPPASQAFEHIDLVHRTIPGEVLERIPEETARKYRVIVFDVRDLGQTIYVAALEPQNPQVQELLHFIRDRNHLKLKVFTTSRDSLEAALKLYRQSATTPVVLKASPKIPPPAPTPFNTKLGFGSEEKTTQRPSDGQPRESDQALSTPSQSSKLTTTSSQEVATVRPEDLTTPDLHVPKEEVSSLVPLNADVERDLIAIVGQDITTIDELQEIVKTGFIPKVVGAFILLAVRLGASDIHIQADQENVLVRFRVDGILRDMLLVPIALQAPIISRIKILAKMKIDEQRVPQDGRFDVQIGEHDVDLRVSTFPTVRGEKVVIRLLDKSIGLLKLENLGLIGSRLADLRVQIKKPYGVVLATGPTGSGKSTTLYAVLHEIAGPEVNVVTLEDPVEYEIPGINQAQIKPKIGFGFGEGLRAILRQDPNIIMVGEIRDVETASMTTHAALTGHLVLSTLHTNDASGALPRLINMGVEPFLITSAMNAVLAQRLVRRLCQHCRQSWSPPAEVLESIIQKLSTGTNPELTAVKKKKMELFKAKGCSACTNGFKGRIGIYEVLVMTTALEELAVKKATASDIQTAAVLGGMVTMEQDGLIKALAGQTTLEEVLRVIKTE